MSAAAPLRIPRLASLAFLFAWGVIGGSVGLNALIKSNQQKSKLRSSVPAGTIVDIDTDDVYQSGVVLTTVCALLALLALLFLLPLPRAYSAFLRLKGAVLAFVALWLFATLIPFDHFYATRQAQVSASIGGVQLPAAIVQSVENSLGATAVYKHIHYLTLPAILPWFTFLAAAIAAAVHLVAGARSARAPGVESQRLEEKKGGEI